MLFLLLLTAFASPGRSLQGEVVDLSAPGFVVYWSLSDAGAGRLLFDAEKLAEAGSTVVLVNVDGVTKRSQVAAFVRRHRVTLPVVQDALPLHFDRREPVWQVADRQVVARHGSPSRAHEVATASGDELPLPRPEAATTVAVESR